VFPILAFSRSGGKRVEWTWSRPSAGIRHEGFVRRFIESPPRSRPRSRPLFTRSRSNRRVDSSQSASCWHSRGDRLRHTLDRRGLKALCYVDGKTVRSKYRYGRRRTKRKRLPRAPRNWCSSQPDLIFCQAATSRRNATQATIRFDCRAGQHDPVAERTGRTWDAPSANVTRLTTDLLRRAGGQVLELLKEAVPDLSRVRCFGNPNHAES